MRKFKAVKINTNKKHSLYIFNTNRNKYIKIKGKKESKSKSIITFFYIVFFIIFIIFIIIIVLKRKIISNIIIKSNDNQPKILEQYIRNQKDFCQNPNKYYNQKYEDEISLNNITFKELKYQMYIFKSKNFLLQRVKKNGAYETRISNYIIQALEFYTSVNNITNNKDVYMLDIGGNIGWYPSLLGRYNYNILSFEAYEKNCYVSKKNYCLLNQDSNVIIISKGLGTEEKTCNYFIEKKNAGNGMVICDNNKEKLNDEYLKSIYKKEGTMDITTLNSFLPYLSKKNIALMKLDVEGNELHILEGGKELITKYHVPFVVLEFTPSLLKEAGSDPKELALFFVDNGYNISLNGFLSKDYINVEKLLIKGKNQVNCFFVHYSMNDLIKEFNH